MPVLFSFHKVACLISIFTVLALTGCFGGGGGGSITATATTTAQSLTVGTAMSSFSPLTPSGGTAPYTYIIKSGTLPLGLSLDSVTGTVTGTPSAAYTAANVTFGVKDANFVEASTTSTVSFAVTALPTGYVYAVGLTWMPISTITYTQPAAVTLCAGTINGMNDWRLPTVTELNGLYNAYPNNSSVLLGLGWALAFTWSSTAGSAGSHYGIGLDGGLNVANSDTVGGYATCVR